MGGFFEGAVDLFADQAQGDLRARPPASAEALIEALKRGHHARIAGEAVVPARAAQYAEFPAELDPRLRTALEARGVKQLYRHQREAWAHVRAGSPSTASRSTSPCSRLDRGSPGASCFSKAWATSTCST